MIRRESGYYSTYVKDLMLKAKAYDGIKAAMESDMCTTSILTTVDNIITGTEAELYAAADNRVRAMQNI